MRQAGVLAAAGIVAIEQQRERLIEDHQNARLLAESIAPIEFKTYRTIPQVPDPPPALRV